MRIPHVITLLLALFVSHISAHAEEQEKQDWRDMLNTIDYDALREQSAASQERNRAVEEAEATIKETGNSGEALVTHEEVRLLIEDAIAKHYNITEGEFRLYLGRNFREFKTAEGWELLLTYYPAGSLESRFVVRFAIEDAESKRLGDWQMPVRCEWWRESWIAKRQINAGSGLRNTLFNRQKVDTMRLNDTVVPASTELGEFELAQTVSAGQPLYWKNINSKPVVRKNTTVDIYAQQGNMTIMTKGRALEDGAAGEYIAIRNLESKRDITAEVINANSVLVHF